MRSDLDDEWVDLIWSHSILPYIEEQLFGEEDRLAEFRLDQLRNHTPVHAPAITREATVDGSGSPATEADGV